MEFIVKKALLASELTRTPLCKLVSVLAISLLPEKLELQRFIVGCILCLT